MNFLSKKSVGRNCPNVFHLTRPRNRLKAQADVAHEMLRSIPARAKQIMLDGEFGGTDLVRLASEIHRPSFRDRGLPKRHS